jgi:esterase FrsA
MKLSSSASIFALLSVLTLSGCAATASEIDAPGTVEFSATEIEVEEFYRDIRPNHWTWNGTDPILVEQTLARIAAAGRAAGTKYVDLGVPYGPGEWTFEFETMGDRYFALAEAEEKLTKLPGAAANYYQKASAAYTLAKYPLYDWDPDQERTFAKSLLALKKSWELKGYGVETVAIPFDNGTADGLLILPKGEPPEGGWPFAVGSNGSDVNKGEFFSFAENLADRGIAFLQFDILGTGSHADFQLGPDYERLPASLIDYLGSRVDMNADKAGVIGVSFGGNAAVKLAHTRPDLVKAAINFCGPVHTAFQTEVDDVQEIGVMYRKTLLDRIAMPDATDAEFIGYMRNFSLVSQGVLGEGKPKTDTPILSLNAYDDPVAPPTDMDLVNASTSNGLLVYSGANDHCPQDRFVVMPMAADWLQLKLNE